MVVLAAIVGCLALGTFQLLGHMDMAVMREPGEPSIRHRLPLTWSSGAAASLDPRRTLQRWADQSGMNCARYRKHLSLLGGRQAHLAAFDTQLDITGPSGIHSPHALAGDGAVEPWWRSCHWDGLDLGVMTDSHIASYHSSPRPLS